MQAKKKDRRRGIRRFMDKVSEYNDIAEVGEIARRYFAMNAFDCVLTIISVLMGSMTAGVNDTRIVITTDLYTCSPAA